MPFERLSPTSDAFREQLTELTASLFYQSETDAPLQVHHVDHARIGRNFSITELLREFLENDPDGEPKGVQVTAMDGPYSRGAQRFFRHYTDKLTLLPDGQFVAWDPAHRAAAEQWRALFHAWYDHTVQQRLFRVQMPDGVTKRLFAVGRFVHVEFDPETNETRAEPGDWFVLATFTVET